LPENPPDLIDDALMTVMVMASPAILGSGKYALAFFRGIAWWR
jgi:hypothetical protein